MATGTTKQHQESPYVGQVRITDRHITRHGVIQVPKAGADGTEPALVKVHAKYQYRVVDFCICERGSEPLAPKAVAQTGEVLKYENVILECAAINLGGKTASSGGGSGFSGGGANAAIGAVGKQPTGDALVLQNHIFTKRGRYVFLRVDPTTQSGGKLKYPQAPYDEQTPITCSTDSWKSTLLGDDNTGGSAASGNRIDGSQVSGS